MQIRLARRTDAEAVNELLDQLGYPQPDQEETAARIQTWADDPAGATYVADAGHELLGVIAVHLCPFFEREGTWARIVALVVSDRARGQGVGSQLLGAAESFATTHGAHRMEVTSSNHREAAHSFYQRHAYANQSARSSRFLRSLGD